MVKSKSETKAGEWVVNRQPEKQKVAEETKLPLARIQKRRLQKNED